MNIALTILTIIVIVLVVLWAWYKLKDTEEGDQIDIGLGTHVERWAFEVRLIIALLVCGFLLLVALSA